MRARLLVLAAILLLGVGGGSAVAAEPIADIYKTRLGQICAEVWDTKDIEQLRNLALLISASADKLMKTTAAREQETRKTFEAAQAAYREIDKRLNGNFADAVENYLMSGGTPDVSSFKQLGKSVVQGGSTVASGAAALQDVEDLKKAHTVLAEAEAAWREAKIAADGTASLFNNLAECVQDQRRYLTGDTSDPPKGWEGEVAGEFSLPCKQYLRQPWTYTGKFLVTLDEKGRGTGTLDVNQNQRTIRLEAFAASNGVFAAVGQEGDHKADLGGKILRNAAGKLSFNGIVRIAVIYPGKIAGGPSLDGLCEASFSN